MRVRSSVHCAILLACISAIGLAADEPFVDPRLEADRAAMDQKFAVELESLALKCDELKLPVPANVTRAWAIPRRFQVQYHFLPDFFSRDQREKRMPAAPGKSAPDVEHKWWSKFIEVRAAQAARLFELAKTRHTQNRQQESFSLLHEVLREDPDHLQARQILGYVGKPGAWSPQERQPKYSKIAKTETTFNWAPNRHGIVDSAHFRIRTNANAAAAVEAATFLEECHDVWRIVFAGFWLTPEEFQTRWEGKAAEAGKRTKEKFEVVLFASRDEYISQLEVYEKNIAASRGYFVPGRKTSFFYVDSADEEVKANWAHEVSHQLFSAYSRNPPGLTKNANFWVIEGAAMYMESLVAHEGYWTTGGFESGRLQDARHRMRNLKEHASLRELLPLGQEAFQRDPRIRQLYTAGAGFAHFFLDGEKGSHRDGFSRYLKLIYDEQDTPDLLEKELKLDANKIDGAYAAFLDVFDEDLLTLRRPDTKRLVLGRTSVTSKGLEVLKAYTKLKQLDLTDLPIEIDDEISFLAPECDLRELSLFGLKLKSGCGKRLARMKSLKELTLSKTAADDAVCESLSSLPSLEVLYLIATPVTDASEASLMKMKTLKELDLSQTKVTPACIERMKKARPELSITP